MNKKIQLKIKVKGECIIMSVSEELKFIQVLDYLVNVKIISHTVKMADFTFKNYITGELIHTPYISISNIQKMNEKGSRYIQIDWKQQDSNKYLTLLQQNAQYDLSSQETFIQACGYLLSDDLEQILILYQQRKISKQLFSLFHKIHNKIRQKKQTKIEKGVTDTKTKQFQRNQKIMQALVIQKQQLYQNAKKQLQSINVAITKIRNSQDQLKALFQNKQNLNKQVYDGLSAIFQKFESRVKKSQNQLQLQIAKGIQNLLEKSVKQSQKVYHLIKSKTFQIQKFKQNIKKSSQVLKESIQKFTNNQIKEIKSQYFDLKSSNTIRDFMKQIKDKRNIIILFSNQTQVFGIFSVHEFGKLKKSDKGFFFNLINPNIFYTKKGQALWKQSNNDIKIGDSILTMSPSIKGTKLKIKKMGQLSKCFVIERATDLQILGVKQNTIQINSFQCLTVTFVNPEPEEQMPLSDSRTLKTQEDV